MEFIKNNRYIYHKTIGDYVIMIYDKPNYFTPIWVQSKKDKTYVGKSSRWSDGYFNSFKRIKDLNNIESKSLIKIIMES